MPLIFESHRQILGAEMLSQKIELARKAFDAFSRRDVEAVLEISHPEIQFYAVTGELADETDTDHDRGAYWGHEGIRRYFEDLEHVWRQIEVEPREFREAGEFLLVLGHIQARDRNGLRVDADAQWLWKVREGKIAYWAVYTDLDEALEAVAASEQSADR